MSQAAGPIFDAGPRIDPSPALHGEPTFRFFNRVAGDFWDHPRQLVQRWADRITEPAEYADIRSRLRGDDYQFRSAFLELYLHEAFVAAGYDVTIHPPTQGPRHPDFLVVKGRSRVYVEAIVPGASKTTQAASARVQVLLNTLNGVADPNFYLWLDHIEEGTNPPAGADARKRIRHWLKTLDPDDYPHLNQMPTFRWDRGGWVVIVRAMPKPLAGRGAAHAHERSIAVDAHMPAAFVNDPATIRAALAEKHNAYGDLAAPFVIAVGLYSFGSDQRQSTAALYGDEAALLTPTVPGEFSQEWTRQPNGYFGTSASWKNRQVSGVLLVNQLQPESIVNNATMTLWRHPEPTHPLPADLGLPAGTVTLEGDELKTELSTISARDLFGLPDPWPPGEPWAG